MNATELINLINNRITQINEAVKQYPDLEADLWLKDYKNVYKILKEGKTKLSDIDNVVRGWHSAYFKLDYPTLVEGKCLRDLRIEHGDTIEHITGLHPVRIFREWHNEWITIN